MNWALLASGLMFVAVAVGAFGAHGLKNRLSPDMLAVYETGVRYHIYHALALFAVAWLFQTLSGTPSRVYASFAGWAFFVGILLFSGSLYALSLSGVRVLGAITPIGGLSFLAGWFLLALAAYKAFKS